MTKGYIQEILFSVLKKLLSESSDSGSEIHVFDFDDTLVKTSSRIRVVGADGNKIFLTPMEYAKYDPLPGDVFDYSEFDSVNDAVPINPMMLTLKKAIKDFGVDSVFILTARGDSKPVKEFLEKQGVSGIDIIAVGTSHPNAKADVIKNKILFDGIKNVTFYDDSSKNIEAVKALRNDNKLPHVSIKTITVRV